MPTNIKYYVVIHDISIKLLYDLMNSTFTILDHHGFGARILEV